MVADTKGGVVVFRGSHCRDTYLPGSPWPKCHHHTRRGYAVLWPPSNELGGLANRMGVKGEEEQPDQDVTGNDDLPSS